jgi:CRP/FNR family cyclic AMP-dependent transcriptional regulator
MAKERDGALVIEDRPTQQEMASRVGASREMVNRILKDLSEGGYITVARDRITISRTLPRAW